MTKAQSELTDNKNEELEFYERNIHIPSVSPLCYERAYTLKKENVIKLLDSYINASKQLSNYNYFDKLKKLFGLKWVYTELNREKTYFVETVMYNILKENPNWLFESEEIDVKFHLPESGIERVDRPKVKIMIKNFEPIYVYLLDEDKYEFYSENYINFCMLNLERFEKRRKEHEDYFDNLELESEYE